jgi:hydrogenase maturation protease
MRSSKRDLAALVLGVGNVLMGDEGVGVEVARRLQGVELPDGVECLDGGTGGFALLEPMGRARKIVLIDAAVDGAPPGTVCRLTPRFSRDYPRTLTAHDIGLKDLLDAFLLLGDPSEVVLFTISVVPPAEPRLDLSPAVEAAVPAVVGRVLEEVAAP